MYARDRLGGSKHVHHKGDDTMANKTMTPSTTEITSGQIGKFQELLAARLRKSGLQSEPVQKLLEENGDAVADEMVAAIRKRVEAAMVLAPRGSVTVTLAERHDPDAFYRTRSGLYVWDDFRTRVVAKAKPSEAGTTHKIASAELMRDLSDEKIEAGLPVNHLFDERAVSAIIAGLIAMQPNGEEGALIANGYANLFYVGSYVVDVHWYADDREWYVGTCDRDDDGWFTGNRVFSLAN